MTSLPTRTTPGTRCATTRSRAKRMEYFIAFLWVIAALCGVGLAIVYCLGGQAQLEGLLLLVGFGLLGIGLLLWARNLLPGHDITASRGIDHRTSSPEERAAVVESLSRGTDAMMSRRGFLVKKVLVPVGGIFGLAAIFPLASLGVPVRDGLCTTPSGTQGARLVTEDNVAMHVDDIMVDGIMTVFPEGYIDDPTSPVVVLNIGGDPIKAAPWPGRLRGHLRSERHSRLLEDLHSRRVCRQLVQRLVDAAHLPLPSIDLQHPSGRRSGVRPGPEAATAVTSRRPP